MGGGGDFFYRFDLCAQIRGNFLSIFIFPIGSIKILLLASEEENQSEEEK
jgi:hypothetical protein